MTDDSSKKAEDGAELSSEERIRLKKLEKEKLQKEAEAKRAERLEREAAAAKIRAEEELKQKVKEAAAAKIKAEEDKKRKIIEDEERRIREIQEAEEAERKRIEFLAAEKERLKREREEEIKRLKAERERELKEIEEKKRREQEQFYSKLGLGPDGKPIDDDIPVPIKEEETVEEAATRRFVLDELEFHLDGNDDNDDKANKDERFNEAAKIEQEVSEFIDSSEFEEDDKSEDQDEMDSDSFSIDQLLANAKPSAPVTASEITPFYSDSCQFCKIALRQLKPLMVYESDFVMAFLDPKPIHKGQLIITTKSHYPSLDKLPFAVMNDLIQGAQNLTTALKGTTLDCEGVSLYMSESVDIAIDERHLYMSAIPRRKADGVTIKFGKKDQFEKSEMLAISQEIKSKL